MTELSELAVGTELLGRVLVVRLASPPANALGTAIVDGLNDALETAERTEARAIVISSAVNGFFAAGADIKHMANIDADGFAEYRDRLRAPLARLADGVVSIAAIDGRALGGGLELAMACTMRVATRASRLGLPEVKLGLIPGAGGTQRLPRLVGRGRALEIMLSGREVHAEEASQIGLIDRLVDDGKAEAYAIDLARRLASASRHAVDAIRRCVDAAEGDLDDGLAVEGDAVLEMFADGEAREGLSAFVERRAPQFT